MPIKRVNYFLRHGGISALCAVEHNVLMWLFTLYGLWYVFGFVLSFLCVAATGYGLNLRMKRLSFSHKSLKRYFFGMSLNLPAGLVAMLVLVSIFSLPVVLSSVLVTGLLILMNYAISHWAFHHV